MSSTQQKALILPTKQGEFVVGAIDIPTPGPGHLLVKIHSSGLNPVDWKIQKYGRLVETYPAVLGTDIAGVVEAVGEGVTAFEKGQHVVSMGKWHNDYAGFQQFAVTSADFSAKIPPSVSFDQAASLPMGLATASVGLYQKADYGAGLTAPWEQGGKEKYKGKPLLVFGGAGSVGSYVIQFAKLSGFAPIITTASPHNTAQLLSLGATHVIDRNRGLSLLPADIVQITAAPIEIVFDTVSNADTQAAALGVLAPGGALTLVLPSSLPVVEGKTVRSTFASPFHPPNKDLAVGLHAHLTAYLADGSIQPNRVEVLPGGLNGIVGGLERLREGKVSGVKLVARPQETAL